MAPEPLDDLGMLVRGVVVEGGVDGLARRDLTLDGVFSSVDTEMPV